LSSKKSKTVLRTVRISQQLDSLLSRDAKAKGMSLNSLITRSLTRYAEWDRYMEKFGHICLTRDAFRTILETTNDEQLARAAQQLGTRLSRDTILFWFKELTLENFLRYVSVFCKYGQVADYELENEGRNYTITAHHDLGEKWSNYLKTFVEHTMKTTLGITPQIEVSKNSVVVLFQAPVRIGSLSA
jgi:hypothetical protein